MTFSQIEYHIEQLRKIGIEKDKMLITLTQYSYDELTKGLACIYNTNQAYITRVCGVVMEIGDYNLLAIKI